MRLLRLVVGLGALGCASASMVLPPPDPEPVPAAPLAKTRAPATASFRTVGNARASLPREVFAGFGRATFLKLALDESLARGVVITRVKTDAAFDMDVSVPTSTEQLHYEIYDETGRRSVGTLRTGAPVVGPNWPETTTTTTATQTTQIWNSYPSATDFYTVGYEDQYPALGDYDFNDVLVSYRTDVARASDNSVLSLQGTAYLLARGARFDHDWHLHVPLGGTTAAGTIQLTRTEPDATTSTTTWSFTGDLDLTAFASTKSFGLVNTDPTRPFARGPRIDFMVQLANAVPAAKFGNPPFDPYIVVRDSGYEVHLPGNAPTPGSLNRARGMLSFKDENGWPFAMLLPVGWSFPWERIDLGLAYPELQTFVTSGETLSRTWYDRPDTAKVRKYAKTEWEWR